MLVPDMTLDCEAERSRRGHWLDGKPIWETCKADTWVSHHILLTLWSACSHDAFKVLDSFFRCLFVNMFLEFHPFHPHGDITSAPVASKNCLPSIWRWILSGQSIQRPQRLDAHGSICRLLGGSPLASLGKVHLHLVQGWNSWCWWFAIPINRWLYTSTANESHVHGSYHTCVYTHTLYLDSTCFV